MIEPKRLVEEGSSFDRALLRAGREDRPSIDYERRVLSAAATLPAAVSAPTGRPSLLGRLARPHYVAMVVSIGAGAAFVSTTSAEHGGQDASAPPAPVMVREQESDSDRIPSAPTSIETSIKAAQAVAVMTPDALPSVPAREPAPPRSSAPLPAPSAAAEAASRAAAPRTVSGASLQREVELLDSVKRSLRTGALADAQRALDGYDSEFPAGTLKPEAGFLRIRLLLARGERARAVYWREESARAPSRSVTSSARNIRTASTRSASRQCSPPTLAARREI